MRPDRDLRSLHNPYEATEYDTGGSRPQPPLTMRLFALGGIGVGVAGLHVLLAGAAHADGELGSFGSEPVSISVPDRIDTSLPEGPLPLAAQPTAADQAAETGTLTTGTETGTLSPTSHSVDSSPIETSPVFPSEAPILLASAAVSDTGPLDGSSPAVPAGLLTRRPVQVASTTNPPDQPEQVAPATDLPNQPEQVAPATDLPNQPQQVASATDIAQVGPPDPSTPTPDEASRWEGLDFSVLNTDENLSNLLKAETSATQTLDGLRRALDEAEQRYQRTLTEGAATGNYEPAQQAGKERNAAQSAVYQYTTVHQSRVRASQTGRMFDELIRSSNFDAVPGETLAGIQRWSDGQLVPANEHVRGLFNLDSSNRVFSEVCTTHTTCGNVAEATLCWMQGRPACAATIDQPGFEQPRVRHHSNRDLDRKNWRVGPYESLGGLAEYLSTQPDGLQGVVYGRAVPGAESHAFNFCKIHGEVCFVNVYPGQGIPLDEFEAFDAILPKRELGSTVTPDDVLRQAPEKVRSSLRSDLPPDQKKPDHRTYEAPEWPDTEWPPPLRQPSRPVEPTVGHTLRSSFANNALNQILVNTGQADNNPVTWLSNAVVNGLVDGSTDVLVNDRVARSAFTRSILANLVFTAATDTVLRMAPTQVQEALAEACSDENPVLSLLKDLACGAPDDGGTGRPPPPSPAAVVSRMVPPAPLPASSLPSVSTVPTAPPARKLVGGRPDARPGEEIYSVVPETKLLEVTAFPATWTDPKTGSSTMWLRVPRGHTIPTAEQARRGVVTFGNVQPGTPMDPVVLRGRQLWGPTTDPAASVRDPALARPVVSAPPAHHAVGGVVGAIPAVTRRDGTLPIPTPPVTPVAQPAKPVVGPTPEEHPVGKWIRENVREPVEDQLRAMDRHTVVSSEMIRGEQWFAFHFTEGSAWRVCVGDGTCGVYNRDGRLLESRVGSPPPELNPVDIKLGTLFPVPAAAPVITPLLR